MKTFVYEENDKAIGFMLNKQELTALLSHAGKDATREAVYSLAFDTEKCRVMVTDGHRLVVCQCLEIPKDSPIKAGEGKTYLLPRHVAEDVAKRLIKSEEASFRFDDATGEGIVWTTMGTSRYKLSKAEFPPTDQVIPKYDDETKSCTKIGFNPFYLADLELIGKATGEKMPTLTLRLGPTATDPGLMTVRSSARDCEWTVVLMPVRI